MVDVPIRISDCGAYYSGADSEALCDHLRHVPWEDILKLGASATGTEFYEWVQIGINVYIRHRKYQVKLYLSPWFWAACAAVIFHGNHFFCLYQQNKSSAYRFLKVPNLTKESITSHKLCSRDFGELLIGFSTKLNLLYLLYLKDLRCCRVLLIKQSCLQKAFLRTLILMIQVSLQLLFFLGLIWSGIICNSQVR